MSLIVYELEHLFLFLRIQILPLVVYTPSIPPQNHAQISISILKQKTPGCCQPKIYKIQGSFFSLLFVFSVRANTFLWQLRFLAHLVMSLCNHALSVMWCCRLCHWHWHWWCWRHLCTALPVTALIIETLYLANICSYTPSICTWNIRSMWHVFFKWQPFYQISLCGSPVYTVKLRAFIFDTVMHLYWGYLEGRNYAPINNILKVMNFLKNSHFALFASFDIHHLTYMPKILILHLAYHTHTYRYTQTHTDTIFTFCTFWLIWYTCQIYLAYHRLTHAQILRHMYRDIDTQIQIHWDTCKFVNTCMFVYIHKHTHTQCVCGESKEIVTSKALAR